MSVLITGPTRKQNVACDACRAKKVRAPLMVQCEQCAGKHIECTSNYIEQLQSRPRRPRRLKGTDDLPHAEKRGAPDTDDGEGSLRGSPVRRTSGPSDADASSSSNGIAATAPTARGRPGEDVIRMDDAMALIAWMNPPGTTGAPAPRAAPGSNAAAASSNAAGPKDGAALQADLLHFLFSPIAVLHHEWRYSDLSNLEQVRTGQCDLWEEAGGAVWEEGPTAAHLALWAGGEPDLTATAVELMDSFFAIVNTRLPIIDEDSFLGRFAAPATHPSGPIPHGLLAVVLAFGAKFTENQALLNDRDECSTRDGDDRSRSRIVQLLAIRAREVAEINKVFRIPSLVHAQTLILLEGVVGRESAVSSAALTPESPVLKRRYTACYLYQASRLLSFLHDVGVNRLLQRQDERTRTQIALFIISGFESAFSRLREPFDITVDPTPTEQVPPISVAAGTSIDDEVRSLGNSEAEQPLMPQTWILAATTAASICRKFTADLWLPRVAASGVPLSVLRDFVHEHSSWRERYLGRLGVPQQWPESWDFAAAIKACSTDILYHALWLVAEGAVRDFGIAEADDHGARSMLGVEVGQMRERLKHEALHGAMRIAALSAVLLEHGYLRLDPLVLYRPIYDAGLFLARQGRDEARALVAALKQYATPYPQMWDLAEEIDAVLAKAAGGQTATAPAQGEMLLGPLAV